MEYYQIEVFKEKAAMENIFNGWYEKNKGFSGVFSVTGRRG